VQKAKVKRQSEDKSEKIEFKGMIYKVKITFLILFLNPLDSKNL